jgi:hypothetical protein
MLKTCDVNSNFNHLFVCVRLFYVRVQWCRCLGLGGSITAWTERDRASIHTRSVLPQPLFPIRTFWLESTLRTGSQS